MGHFDHSTRLVEKMDLTRQLRDGDPRDANHEDNDRMQVNLTLIGVLYWNK